MKVYLRLGDDTLEQAKRYSSKWRAVEAFADTARELARYDQRIEASLHCAHTRDELQEYPDFVLSLGARGGIRCERA